MNASVNTVPMRPRRQKNVPVWLRAWNVVVIALLILPVMIVIPMSFSGARNFSFPPKGFSLRWYENFFSSAKWMDSLLASLQVGVLSAVIATVLGTLAAVAIARMSPRFSSLLSSVYMAPMIVPGVIFAVAIYAVFLRWQLTGGLFGFVAAHTMLALPFVITSVSSSLSGYNAGLTTAASSLGAGPVKAFVTVTLPLILPGVVSGFVLAFVTSFDESVVSLFLATPALKTLPVNMYDAIATEIDPTVSAAATLVILVTTIVVVLAQVLPGRKKRK
ncbi:MULTISPECIES: ABC transporter permease [Micrococcales]|jgi:putative spermidine/putrescine transport system permease protein|uniref:ABC transporter permease n=1 Tax=Micrococcales TaxID=85006 RepID=UPI001D1754C2|nr:MULTISPECIES: ABC transporter permease [Micrococcales]